MGLNQDNTNSQQNDPLVLYRGHTFSSAPSEQDVHNLFGIGKKDALIEQLHMAVSVWKESPSQENEEKLVLAEQKLCKTLIDQVANNENATIGKKSAGKHLLSATTNPVVAQRFAQGNSSIAPKPGEQKTIIAIMPKNGSFFRTAGKDAQADVHEYVEHLKNNNFPANHYPSLIVSGKGPEAEDTLFRGVQYEQIAVLDPKTQKPMLHLQGANGAPIEAKLQSKENAAQIVAGERRIKITSVLLQSNQGLPHNHSVRRGLNSTQSHGRQS